MVAGRTGLNGLPDSHTVLVVVEPAFRLGAGTEGVLLGYDLDLAVVRELGLATFASFGLFCRLGFLRGLLLHGSWLAGRCLLLLIGFGLLGLLRFHSSSFFVRFCHRFRFR